MRWHCLCLWSGEFRLPTTSSVVHYRPVPRLDAFRLRHGRRQLIRHSYQRMHPYILACILLTAVYVILSTFFLLIFFTTFTIFLHSLQLFTFTIFLQHLQYVYNIYNIFHLQYFYIYNILQYLQYFYIYNIFTIYFSITTIKGKRKHLNNRAFL